MTNSRDHDRDRERYLTDIRARATRLDGMDNQIRQRITDYEALLNTCQPGCRVVFTTIEEEAVVWGKYNGAWRILWGQTPLVSAPRHIRAEFLPHLCDSEILGSVVTALDHEIELREHADGVGRSS